jgi:hypothetical protein
MPFFEKRRMNQALYAHMNNKRKRKRKKKEKRRVDFV